MDTQSWLPLTEYSSKYRISVSTLRRRIKLEEVPFQFRDGKYLVVDEPLDYHQKPPRPSQSSVDDLMVSKAELPNFAEAVSAPNGNENLLMATNRLLSELKKAYSQVLQEKEEQILGLRDEVADLKTLVKVLESHSARKSLS